MAYPFPSEEWLQAFVSVLNTDTRYAEVASNWEGDFLFEILPDSGEKSPLIVYYLDLWHGKCRKAFSVQPGEGEVPETKFTLTAPLGQFRKVLSGELDAMQGMLTRRLMLKGSMAYLMRNVPVVLDFVRCARLVPIAEEPGDA
jgi:putative sterol carrier protein